MTQGQTLTRLRSLLVPLCAVLAPGTAFAACDLDYLVKPGDTYYSIAAEHYGNRRDWQRVYQANQNSTGMPTLLPGKSIYIPCHEGRSSAGAAPETPTKGVTDVQITSASQAPVPTTPERAEPRRSLSTNVELKLLTGGNYAPFTDRDLPGEGLVTELIHAALETSPNPVTYSLTWDDNWSQHLFPLLDQQTFDMGFPWLKPDCDSTPGDDRCKNFLFSDPVMSLPMMLFVRQDSQFSFNSDGDILGKTLCRPAGYFTHDLDRADRRWLSRGLITLVQGRDPADCFNQVLNGQADAATLNLFLGANLLEAMGLRNQILPLEKPLSEEGLHVVISKAHWRGTTHLYRINAGLQKLKEEGRYQEIVARHLELFRSQLR